MTAGTIIPYQSSQHPAPDSFGHLIRAEWTKFRTVRGWLIGMTVAALVTVGLGVLTASGSVTSCQGPASICGAPPLGPGGEQVTDSFYFVHQPLASSGSLTTRLTSLTGLMPTVSGSGGIRAGQGALSSLHPGVQPWSKAGIIIKATTKQGSAYAAMMVTGGHGVRMQYDYTQDVAGLPGRVSAAAPRWLRLTRSGDTITGYDSADGAHWTRVGTATLPGLPATVQAGLFVASPDYSHVTSTGIGSSRGVGGPTQATARFGAVRLHGGRPGGSWAGLGLGTAAPGQGPGVGGTSRTLAGFRQAGGTFTVTGTGDIAPAVAGAGPGGGTPIENTLVGAFAGLIAVTVVAAMFITAEYRRGLIRVTLAASPRRGRVLLAKAIVVGSVTFVVGLAAAAVAVPLAGHVLRQNGFRFIPISSLGELRVVAGTAALLAVAAVLALGTGAVLRRSAAAITLVIAAIVLPYILTTGGILPTGASQWVLRLTPAAAFAIQQTVTQYPQVVANYSPVNGYFPLPPWAGFAVLCGYAAVALGLAAWLLRRRDA